MYKLAAMVTEHDAKKAGAEVVKQVDSPSQSGLLYPGLQALDEQYLGVDAQFGGVDQRKIFTYAEKYLPKLGYTKRSHLMNPMVPGLTGGKMSSSEIDSKIDLLDSAEAVERKLMGAICEPSVDDNGVMAFINYVVFPILEGKKEKFVLENKREFSNFAEFKSQIIKDKVDGEIIKRSVVKFLNKILDHIRNEFKSPKLVELTKKAYPVSQVSDKTEGKSDIFMNREITSNISIDERFNLLSRNLASPPPQEIKSYLSHSLNVVWSVDVTGRPKFSLLGHVAKIRDFVNAGCKVTVLATDIASHLDSSQVTYEIAPKRAEFILELLKIACKIHQVNMERVTFLRGSDFQRSEKYVLDLYKITALVSCKESHSAVSDVVKDPNLLSALLYPDMAALDEKYSGAHVRYAEKKFEPVFKFAEESLPLINECKRMHLSGQEMPSLLNKAALNPEEEYIDLIEQDSQIKKKIKSAFCEEGNIEFNPILDLAKMIIIPLLGNEKLVIKRIDEHGGNLEIENYEALVKLFESKELHPGDLKNAIMEYLKKIIEPIRKAAETPDMKKKQNQAYPPPPKKAKGPPKPAAGADEFVPSKFEMRVGKIVEVDVHPDAESLYVEKIDLGESEPRTIISGLVKHVPIDQMKNRMVVVLANLKPQNMRGIKSCGMVLCASSDIIEPLDPAEGSKPGDKVFADGYEGESDPVLNTKKSDALTKMLSGFKVNNQSTACWNDCVLSTSAGPVKVKTLKNTPIK